QAEGELEYLGRLDSQVKVRGHRIELGEIESVLGQHTGVRQYAVWVKEYQPGGKRLIAYIVPTEGALMNGAELREYLKSKLPEYMVPWKFVLLEKLPLTVNGKLDRRALPWPTPAERAGENESPRSPIEEIVAGAWAEVLRLEKVGVNENFFELGGHSLLATQVISRVRDTLKAEVPLRTLFENPTV